MKQYLSAIIVITLCACFFTTKANAIPIVWGTAEKVAKIYEFPQNDNYKVSGQHMDLGYKYKAFEIFWVPLHAYEGKVVGYIDDKTYVGLTDRDISVLVAENNIKDLATISKIPFWDSWGGKLTIALLVIVFIFISWKGKNKPQDNAESNSVSDDNDPTQTTKTN